MAIDREREKRRSGDKDPYDFWEDDEDSKESGTETGKVSENYERAVVRSSLKAGGGPETTDKKDKRREGSEGDAREELEEP